MDCKNILTTCSEMTSLARRAFFMTNQIVQFLIAYFQIPPKFVRERKKKLFLRFLTLHSTIRILYKQNEQSKQKHN